MCKFCKTYPETDKHFVIYCDLYATLRDNLWKEILIYDKDFHNIVDDDKFQYLMASSNIDVIKSVMKYIYDAMNLRERKLQQA